MKKLEIPGPAKRYPQQVLLDKINELVDEVVELKREVKRLNLVKAKKETVYGAPRGNR